MLTPYPGLIPAEKTQHLLEELITCAGASAAYLHDLLGRDDDPLAWPDTAQVLDDEERAHVQALLRGVPHHGTGSSAYFVPREILDGLPFADALLIPLATSARTAGAVGLFWRQRLTAKQQARIETDAQHDLALRAEVLRLHIENTALETTLSKNVSSAQSILMFAEALGENSSPQRVVDILVENLLDLSYVSGCALLMFSPPRDGQDAPEYLEVRGTWSRRLGSGVAMGMRLYLRDNPVMIRELNVRRVMVFDDVNTVSNRTDPLVGAWLKRERICSGTLLTLQLGALPLGVIAIGTDKPHQFTARELHDYRTIAEFLSISVMAQNLQQQRDSVQQGRAALLESVTDGVVMIMAQAETGGTVLTTNLPFQRMFDLPHGDLRGLNLTELLRRLPLDEETRAVVRAAWMNINVYDQSTQRGEFSITNQQGHAVDIQWYSAPVYQDEHVIGRIYTFNDVSAERAAARLRATFLSRVSHELRTPLTSIHGFAEFLLQSSDNLTPNAREYTQIILNSAKQLKFLVNDLIDIGRANAGALALSKTLRQLPDLLIDAAARLEMEARRRSQTIRFEFEPKLPDVPIDYDRMLQVISNLILNAIKYSPEGGTITIQARYVTTFKELSAEAAPANITLPAIVVTVLDSGTGLTQEDVERIFLPFYRTTSAKVAKAEGVGLGLAIAQSLIEAHRGRIWAVPAPPAPGGCFKVTIPTAHG